MPKSFIDDITDDLKDFSIELPDDMKNISSIYVPVLILIDSTTSMNDFITNSDGLEVRKISLVQKTVNSISQTMSNKAIDISITAFTDYIYEVQYWTQLHDCKTNFSFSAIGNGSVYEALITVTNKLLKRIATYKNEINSRFHNPQIFIYTDDEKKKDYMIGEYPNVFNQLVDSRRIESHIICYGDVDKCKEKFKSLSNKIKYHSYRETFNGVSLCGFDENIDMITDWSDGLYNQQDELDLPLPNECIVSNEIDDWNLWE